MTRAETRYGPKHWQAAQRGALECSPWAKAQSVVRWTGWAARRVAGLLALQMYACGAVNTGVEKRRRNDTAVTNGFRRGDGGRRWGWAHLTTGMGGSGPWAPDLTGCGQGRRGRHRSGRRNNRGRELQRTPCGGATKLQGPTRHGGERELCERERERGRRRGGGKREVWRPEYSTSARRSGGCIELLSTILVLWAMLCYQFGNVKV